MRDCLKNRIKSATLRTNLTCETQDNRPCSRMALRADHERAGWSRLKVLRVFSFLTCLCLFSLVPLNVSAANIKQADVELLGDAYVLNAELDYDVSPAAKEALLKGIALSWRIGIIVKQQRYIWDKEIRRIILGYQIRYFPLLNVYRVKAEHNGQMNNFSSLSAALDSIASMHTFKLIDKAQLHADQHYVVALKIFFDREALPIPLRPSAYFDAQWALSSDWFTCLLGG